MVWSQFSIKILGVHSGSSVVDNSSWDKISHSFAKKSVFGTECNSLLDKKKKNCKSNPLIQTLIYRSNIYYSKIYHKGTSKSNSSTPYLLMWQEINFFQSPILISKNQKCSLNRGTLVPAPAIYQTKCPFLFFERFPMI